MPVPDLFGVFLRPLNQSAFPYMLTGAVAAILYGEPRLTHDLDIVLRLAPGDALRLFKAFPDQHFYRPPLETLQAEAARGSNGHFNLVHLETALRADIYLVGEDPFLQWGLAHRRSEPLGKDLVWIAPPEYVIVMKLRYYRESGSDRHLRDVAGMVEVSGAKLDRSVLARWVEEFELGNEWARIEGPL